MAIGHLVRSCWTLGAEASGAQQAQRSCQEELTEVKSSIQGCRQVPFFRGVRRETMWIPWDFSLKNVDFIWVNYITPSLFSLTGNHGLFLGNHPQMAQQFRLVKYYNLPRNVDFMDFNGFQHENPWISRRVVGWVAGGCWDDDITSDDWDSRKFPA
jgi:hypothetical protein